MSILEQSKPTFDEYRKDNTDQYKEIRKRNNLMPDLSSMIGEKKKEEDVKKKPGINVNTYRLNTPKLKRMALINDGSQALKDEINESYLRVKAAKHGMRLSDVIPNHGIKFYLPNKLNYIRPKEYQKVADYNTKTTNHEDHDSGVSNTFITGIATLNQSRILSNKLGLNSTKHSTNNNLNKSALLRPSQPSHFKSKSMNISKMMVPSTTKNSTNKHRSNVLSEVGRRISHKQPQSMVNSPTQNKFGSSPEVPQRLNGVSHKFNRDQNIAQIDQRRKIRLISLIDSKPINHYVTLL